MQDRLREGADKIDVVADEDERALVVLQRADERVDWTATKALNLEFNPDVDGCESFVMRDGSVCAWVPGRFAYAPRAKP